MMLEIVHSNDSTWVLESIAVFVDMANHLFPIYGKCICLPLLLLGANTAWCTVLCVVSTSSFSQDSSVLIGIIPTNVYWSL